MILHTVGYLCFFLVMIFLHFIVFLQFRKTKLENKEWNFRESFLTKEFMKYDCCHILGTFLLLRLLHYVCECLVGFALILIVWNFPSYFVSSNNNIKIRVAQCAKSWVGNFYPPPNWSFEWNIRMVKIIDQSDNV